MKKRIVTLSLVVALAATAIIGGTMAYFTDTKEASNTFTVGNVAIWLDEAKVNEYGQEIDNKRVTSNEYKLIPGHTYVKDPTVTVYETSEPCYVRMLVTINKIEALNKLFDGQFLPQYFVDGWDNDVWVSTNEIKEGEVGDTLVYEFRYKEIVNAKSEHKVLEPLFETFTLPADLTGEEVSSIEGMSIDVTAQAIQQDGFNTADEAWAAFDAQ